VRVALACGKTLERMDSALRQWPVAGVSLLILTVVFAAAVFTR
jgi:hypothetical protein